MILCGVVLFCFVPSDASIPSKKSQCLMIVRGITFPEDCEAKVSDDIDQIMTKASACSDSFDRLSVQVDASRLREKIKQQCF